MSVFTKNFAGFLINDNSPISGGGNSTIKNDEIIPLGLVFINKPKLHYNNNVPISPINDNKWNKLYKKVNKNDKALYCF